MISNNSSWELKFFDAAKNWRKYQFKIISKYIQRNILEVGPGTGHNLKYYKNKATTITLLEINKKLARSLKKKFYKNKKIKILNSNIYSIKKKFDTIMYMDVLEHIKTDKKEIKKAINLLNPSGYLIIFVPAFQILYSNFDRDIGHVRRYRKFFFLNIAKKYKVKLIELKYFDSIGFIFAIINRLVGTNNQNNVGLGIKIWNNFIFLSKFFDFILKNMFGKSLLCVLKKDDQ